MPNAKLGAKVDRYSFFVRLLPPLLHTGLARRTNIPISLIFPSAGVLSEMAWSIRGDVKNIFLLPPEARVLVRDLQPLSP
jgi:hypothetical protein